MELQDNAAALLGRVIDLREVAGIGASSEDLRVLCRSARFGTIAMLKSHMGHPVGYLAYAKINSASIRAMLSSRANPAFFYEWDEGYYTYIADVVFLPGWSRHAQVEVRKFCRESKVFVYIQSDTLVISKYIGSKRFCRIHRIQFTADNSDVQS